MFSWLDPPARPLLIGHRGSSRHVPENTLAAFFQAVSDGARAIELDVRLSRDHEVVVIHDARLHRTTDGLGRVRDHSLKELKRLSAGAWFDHRYARESIPTLSEVLESVDPSVGINVEMKIDRDGSEIAPLVDRCYALVARHNLFPKVLLTSFSTKALRYAAARYPAFTIGILTHPLIYPPTIPARLIRKLNACYLVCHSRMLRQRFLRHAEAEGVRVLEYTVNTQAQLSRSIRRHVDGILSDVPADLLPFLAGDKNSEAPGSPGASRADMWR